MIFSQKITERGKPDASECMSFLTARNLVSRIHRICFWPSRVFGSSSGHLRIVFGLFGQRYPADQKARRLWVRDWLCSNWSILGDPRIGQITVPMDKGNAGSGEEKDSKCRQDPSGRPARVVKQWGGGGSPSSVSRSHRMEIYFPFYEKQFGKRSPLWITIQERKSLFHAEKRLKAQIPFTTHWHFAMFALINCSNWIKLSVDETKMTRLWARIGSVLQFISFMIKKLFFNPKKIQGFFLKGGT